MINKVNYQPSFKKIHIRYNDRRTVSNNLKLFDTEFKKIIFDSEMRLLDRETGKQDVFLSNTCTRIDEYTGDTTYELGLTDKDYNNILCGIKINKSDSPMAIKSKFANMNEVLHQMRIG